ncbi:H-type lectin domain-containing protein [Paracoccus ravus]|uniref:H-type lectin domain-containing protein n=1 Tax=Paracoccus ravus TaxID=2447760 RepID=UPI001FD69AC3|nr:H-type lectin domain-containing protein [Paracoccus ravus]
MRRFDHFSVGVANGALDLFSAFEEGQPMWTGHGPRLERSEVRFDEPFAEPPAVHLSLVMWDIAVNANQRVDLRATDVTTEGFVVEFRTWGDTRVARARASWMAIGPVRYLEDFDAG